MGKFEVTAQEISNAISDLTSKNAEFKAKVNALEAKQQELSAMWQGDANNVFKASFEADKAKWEAFANLITTYIEGLGRILDTYNKAEAANTATAKNRTY